MFGSEVGTPSSASRSIAVPRVMPCSAPDDSGGVNIRPSLRMKILSPVH
jgi:hypothetical protein